MVSDDAQPDGPAETAGDDDATRPYADLPLFRALYDERETKLDAQPNPEPKADAMSSPAPFETDHDARADALRNEAGVSPDEAVANMVEKPELAYCIVLVDKGFVLRDPAAGDDGLGVDFDAVREIVAYRSEPAGRDLLCMEFRISAGRDYVKIHEDMPGYGEALEKIYTAFPDISRSWWHEIAEGLGSNRTTLHGLTVEQDDQPSAAERYLNAVQSRKPIKPGTWKRWLGAGVMLFLVAGGQLMLANLIASPGDGGWDDVLALTLLPFAGVVLMSRLCPDPKTLLRLLGGFYLAELAWLLILAPQETPTFVGKILEGKLNYLLLPGVAILLGMIVMLLPDKHAAGKRAK